MTTVTETGQDVAVTAKTEAQREAVPAGFSAVEEMERMLDRLMPRGWLRPLRAERFGLRIPSVDVLDQDECVLVRAELPGVAKEELEVVTTEKSLSIRAKACKSWSEQEGDLYRSEISQSAWQRSLLLPSVVDPEKVTASLQAGILEITLPKTNGARRHHVTIE